MPTLSVTALLAAVIATPLPGGYSCPPGGPVNDCAVNPIQMSPGESLGFDTTTANTDGPPNFQCSYGKDIWYLVQAPSDGEFSITVDTPTFDSTFAVYFLGMSSEFVPEDLFLLFTGCVNSPGPGGESIEFPGAAGAYYLLQVAGFQGGPAAQSGPGQFGGGMISIGSWGTALPLNDDCGSAIPIGNGLTPFSTIGATTDGPGLPVECERGFGLTFNNDVWYLYTATCDGTATFSTCNSADFDTRLALYTLPCQDLRLVCCNDDAPGCDGFTSTMTCDVECDKVYLLRVGGFGTATGGGTLNVSCSGSPCEPCCPDPVCTILLRSGQYELSPGEPGQVDSEIRWTSIISTEECTDFSIADASGTLPTDCFEQANIVAPYPVWKPTLECDPSARWINSTIDGSLLGAPGQSVVYCHPFFACDAPFDTACIRFCWMADDRLGDPPGGTAPIGVYLLNGSGNLTPLPALFGGHYAVENTVTASIPAGAIQPGLNHLIVYQRNLQFGCAASGVIYSARIDLCKSCVTPPWGMTGWWPLDEPTGVISHDLTSNGNDGQWQGGPTPIAGVVDGALNFDGVDDRVVVPASSDLDIHCTAFTVDAWINWTPQPVGSSSSVIVSRWDGPGWALSVSNGEYPISQPVGTLLLFLGSDCLSGEISSAATIPPFTWTHVAVSVSGCQCTTYACGSWPQFACCADPAYARSFTFYINGQPAGTGSLDGCDLSFLGPAELIIGSSLSINSYFKGAIDEVELFCRALSESEIHSIWAAGALGKCKEQCWASSNRQSCGVGSTGDGEATIVNNSSAARTYSYSITETLGCTVTGMTYVPASGTISVGPYGGKGTVKFGAQGGGASGYGKACFKVTFTNQSTDEECTAFGNVIHQDCSGIGEPPCCDTTSIELPMGGEGFGSFQFTAGPEGANLDYQAIAIPLDAAMYDVPLSLGDLPPGEPITGSVTAGPLEDIDIGFPLLWPWCGWFAVGFDVQLLVAPAGSGGPFEVISSFMVTMAVEDGSDCPADLTGDGSVDGADLGIMLGSWGVDGPADLDGNGVVDGGDLGLLLGAWGACP